MNNYELIMIVLTLLTLIIKIIELSNKKITLSQQSLGLFFNHLSEITFIGCLFYLHPYNSTILINKHFSSEFIVKNIFDHAMSF